MWNEVPFEIKLLTLTEGVDCGSVYKNCCLVNKEFYRFAVLIHPKAKITLANPIKTLLKIGHITPSSHSYFHNELWLGYGPSIGYDPSNIEYNYQGINQRRSDFFLFKDMEILDWEDIHFGTLEYLEKFFDILKEYITPYEYWNHTICYNKRISSEIISTIIQTHGFPDYYHLLTIDCKFSEEETIKIVDKLISEGVNFPIENIQPNSNLGLAFMLKFWNRIKPGYFISAGCIKFSDVLNDDMTVKYPGISLNGYQISRFTDMTYDNCFSYATNWMEFDGYVLASCCRTYQWFVSICDALGKHEEKSEYLLMCKDVPLRYALKIVPKKKIPNAYSTCVYEWPDVVDEIAYGDYDIKQNVLSNTFGRTVSQ